MIHRLPDVDALHASFAFSERLFDDAAKVDIIDGVIRTDCRAIVVENHLLVRSALVVVAKIIDEFDQFTLVLDEKALDRVHSSHVLVHLSHHQPVDVSVEVECNAKRCVRYEVVVHSAIACLGDFPELVFL